MDISVISNFHSCLRSWRKPKQISTWQQQPILGVLVRLQEQSRGWDLLLNVGNDLLLVPPDSLLLSSICLSSSISQCCIWCGWSIHSAEGPDQALNWFRSSLSKRFQFVRVHNYSSEGKRVSYGVPQGSVLRPILYNIYMLPLGNIISTLYISFYCYADDPLLYLSIKTDEAD